MGVRVDECRHDRDGPQVAGTGGGLRIDRNDAAVFD
jgi:hypothetical protein